MGNSHRVAVGVGGNLAAAVSNRLGGAAVLGQVLMYPVTDCGVDNGEPEAASMVTYASGYLLTAAAMRDFRRAYAARDARMHFPYAAPAVNAVTGRRYAPDAAARAHPDCAVLRAAAGVLAAAPRARVILAAGDVLLDEGRACVRRRCRLL